MKTGRILALTAVTVLVSGVMVGIPHPAAADPPDPNDAGQFALNVPSSVLAATSSDPAQRAALASNSSYDWYFADPALALVSGTLTASPSSPATTLSPAQLTQFTTATARTAIPATAPSTVVRPPTFTGAGPVVALLGFQVGLAVGAGGARLFGFKDDQVCAQQNGVLSTIAGVLDGVDCTAYDNYVAQVERDADQVPVSSFDPVTVQGVTVEYTEGVVVGGTHNLMTCFHRTGSVPSGWRVMVEVWGANSSYSYGTTQNGSYCPTTSNLSGWPITAPLLSYRLTVWDRYAPYPQTRYSSVVMTGEISYPGTQRQWSCVVTTNVGTYSATSSPFSELDDTLASIVCPTVPPGERVLSVKIYELGGYQNHLVANQNATSAYTSLATNYPECLNGSCLLDLRKSGVSCFLMTDPTDCDGWMTNTSGYSCWFGTHSVALSECYIYANVFDPTNWSTGTGYADPADGQDTESPTSPSDVDEIVRDLNSREGARFYGDPAKIRSTLRVIAATCITLQAVAKCIDDDVAVFAPGDDVYEAARHDLDAILGIAGPAYEPNSPPEPFILHHTTSPANGAGWYRSTPPCVEGTYPTSLLQCDEYPFRRTIENQPRGPGELSSPSLRVIDKGDNGLEGSYFGAFVSECMPRTNNNEFITIPTPTSAGDVLPVTSTWWYCNVP